MLVTISGAQGVGKTTLIDALKSNEKLNGFNFRTESTREVKEMGFPINEDGTDLTQQIIILKRLESIAIEDNAILDRSILDVHAYTISLYNAGKISDAVMEYSQNMFEKAISKYDIYFYIPPEFDLADDGVRSADVKWRDEMVAIFEDLIEDIELWPDQDIKFIRLTGSVEDRVEKVLSTIEGHKK